MIHTLNPQTGETAVLFCTPDRYQAFLIAEDKYLSKESRDRVAEEAPVVEADFDNRGQLVGLS